MSNSTNTITVFEVLAEGGSISIQRKHGQNGDYFIYHHNEYDPVEDIAITKNDEYKSFEEAFNRIHDRYSWYRLHLDVVAPEYCSFVSQKLVDTLNSNEVSPDELIFRRNQLEKVLHIRLNFDSGIGTWTYCDSKT